MPLEEAEHPLWLQQKMMAWLLLLLLPHHQQMLQENAKLSDGQMVPKDFTCYSDFDG